MNKGYPKELNHVLRGLNSEDLKRFSRKAQNHVNKIDSNLIH